MGRTYRGVEVNGTRPHKGAHSLSVLILGGVRRGDWGGAPSLLRRSPAAHIEIWFDAPLLVETCAAGRSVRGHRQGHATRPEVVGVFLRTHRREVRDGRAPPRGDRGEDRSAQAGGPVARTPQGAREPGWRVRRTRRGCVDG